jgi:hypothetical protein
MLPKSLPNKYSVDRIGVEAAITQTARVVEVAIGQARDGRLELETASMSRTPTAKDIRRLWRVFEVDGDVMHCTVDMEAMGVARTFHLRSTLMRHQPTKEMCVL